MDTIYALASGHGRAGVSVVRISGPRSFQVVERLAMSLPEPRRATVRILKDTAGETIDEALVICFAGPRSFTGEDVVELQVHGSIAVLRRLLTVLSEFEGLRLAEAGEFTRRALDNDRLDLSQVEGLGDLIEAETEAQRRQALRVFSGELGRKVECWREDLIRSAALLEATIDFADEDVPVDVMPEVSALLNRVHASVSEELRHAHAAERIRVGFEVAIVGRPNIGKSTLLNSLAGRDAAITSEIAGTTRDVIEVRMDVGGLPVTFLDTAGLRQSEDQVEQLGIARAEERAKAADLRIFLKEGDESLPVKEAEGDIILRGKADSGDLDGFEGVSGVTGHGIARLLKRTEAILAERSAHAGLATHERHRTAMQRANQGLVQALESLRLGPDHYDITTEELRSAIRALEALVGRIDVEAVLGEIFSSFCLGK